MPDSYPGPVTVIREGDRPVVPISRAARPTAR